MREPIKKRKPKLLTQIKPIKPGTKPFLELDLRIFNQEELGCNAFCWSYLEALCHKLGMGNPLGLGSDKN